MSAPRRLAMTTFDGFPPLAVGDEGTIIVSRTGNRSRTRVVKTGRRWATLDRPEWSGEHRCEMASGRIDGGSYESPGVFYTDTRLDHAERLTDAVETIENHHLRFDARAQWTDARVIALAEWLRS